MKKTLLNFIMSFILTFIPLLLITVLITYLNFKQIITYRTSKIIIYTISSVCFFSFGLIFTKKEKSHGLLHGLILITIYTLLFLILKKEKNTLNILLLIIRDFSLVIGSILGVNLNKEY